jgi:hypothetical protein
VGPTAGVDVGEKGEKLSTARNRTPTVQPVGIARYAGYKHVKLNKGTVVFCFLKRKTKYTAMLRVT